MDALNLGGRFTSYNFPSGVATPVNVLWPITVEYLQVEVYTVTPVLKGGVYVSLCGLSNQNQLIDLGFGLQNEGSRIMFQGPTDLNYGFGFSTEVGAIVDTDWVVINALYRLRKAGA